MGVLVLGRFDFISPEIRSLMSEYFKVIGMFMGALGGLFCWESSPPGPCPRRFLGYLVAWA